MTAILLAFAAAIAGASAQDAPKKGERPGRFDPNAAFITATGLQADGNCAEAIPLYYRLAFRGGGFEESQHRLGQCLIVEGGDKVASTNYLEALVWHRRAAEAGWPEDIMARLEARLSADDIAAGEKRAREWHISHWKPPQLAPRRQPQGPGAEGDRPQARRGDGRRGGRGGGREGGRRPRGSVGP